LVPENPVAGYLFSGLFCVTGIVPDESRYHPPVSA